MSGSESGSGGVFGTLRGLGSAVFRRFSLAPSVISTPTSPSALAIEGTLPANSDAFGLAELINLSSALKQQNELETREKRLPLEKKLTELLDRLHETELELRVIDLLLATATDSPDLQNERFNSGIKEITEDFMRGFEDLLNQRDGIVENGKLVPLDKSKRAQLVLSQRANIEKVLRNASQQLKELETQSSASEKLKKHREDLMALSEKLFEEKNDLTMQLEGDLSEELREKQTTVEAQKRKVISSNLLLVCERGDYEQAVSLLKSLDANKSSEDAKARKSTILFQRDRDGNTPLLVACGAGSLPLVKLLYEAGSALDMANYQDQTVLHKAVQTGDRELIQWLLKHPEWLLAPPPTTNAIDAVCKFGRTPLHYASFSGNVAAVQLLLERGADLNATLAPPQSFTPLHNAVIRRHEEIIKILLDHYSVKPFVCDGQGWTPLHCAVAQQSASIVKIFLEKTTPTKELLEECLKLAKDEEVVALLKQ